MKAVVFTKYGTPEAMKLTDVDKPEPADNEVLIKVLATSVNASDCEFLRGRPAYTRMWGLFRPRYRILGSDVAGTVEAVGGKVTKFQPGDAVFGDILGRWGGFAEFACAPEDALMVKPAGLSFVDASTMPQGALTALQGLRDKKEIGPGDKVLINGAGGGAGTFAVQIAKAFGAEVTGVDSTRKLDTMRSTGADHVIDYTKEDFTRSGEQYDLILDFVASHSIFGYRRSLAPRGAYAMVGGSLPRIFSTLILGSIISVAGSRKLSILAARPNKDMDVVIELMESGKVVPVIDKLYALGEVPEAMRYVGDGLARGKVVITQEDGSTS